MRVSCQAENVQSRLFIFQKGIRELLNGKGFDKERADIIAGQGS